jgi:glutamate synthase (NADPH/NADH) large chain
MCPKFVKVMPVEYRRAILEMEKKRASGAHMAAG